jgi:D-alanine transaminase
MSKALPTCLLDGTLMPTSSARISPFDRGFLFGDGVYEVVPCYSGEPFRLQAHIDRLEAGLDALRIRHPYPRARWAELIRALITANGGGDMGVYLEITRGSEQGRDFLPQPGTIPTVFGFCWRLAAGPLGRHVGRHPLAAL